MEDLKRNEGIRNIITYRLNEYEVRNVEQNFTAREDFITYVSLDLNKFLSKEMQCRRHDDLSSKLKSAIEFLDAASGHMKDRAATYDKPEGERSMGSCVKAFNTITGKDLTESEGWLLLQILKDVRQWQNDKFHRDSAEDCIAYAALKAEALAKGE